MSSNHKENELDLELIEKYKLFVEGSFEGIAITHEGKIVHINDQLVSMFEYDATELLSMTPFSFIAPESHEDVKKGFMGLMEYPYDVITIKKDGTTLPCEVYSKVIIHEGIEYRITSIRDISKRKISENALKESEEKFRQISEQSLLGIYILQDGLLKYVNDKFCEIQGYPKKELLSLTAEEIDQNIHPDDLGMIKEQRRKILSGEEEVPDSIQHRIITKQGEVRWVEVHSRSGEYQGRTASFGTLIDISNQINTNASLKESEEKFRQISEQSLLGIFILQDDVFKYVNDKLCEIHGYTREELLEFNDDQINKMIHPEDLQFIIEQRVKKQEGEYDVVNSFQHRIITKIGETRWVEVHSKTGQFQGKNAIYGTLIDFTEQYQALKSLTESEQRYRTLFDSSPVGILVIRDSLILYANPQFLKLYEFDPKTQVIGSPVQNIQAPEVRKELTDRGRKREKGEKVNSSYDSVGLKKDNTSFPIHVEVTQIVLNDGPATLVFIQDLTEIKRVEEEKKNLQTKIQQVEKYESLGNLAGAIAHDFNNILMSIINYANLAKADLDDDSNTLNFLTQIENSSIRAANLSKQMLALSGKGKFLVETLNLCDLLLGERHFITELLPENIKLNLNFDTSYAPIDGDKIQIMQILENLVNNSIDAIGSRTGTVYFQIGEFDFEEKHQSEFILGDSLAIGKFVYIDVKDTGKGFDKGYTDKIFDPFYTTKFVGRGLGLPVVLGIVRGHKGAIKVISNKKDLTTIRILLPISKKSIVLKEKQKVSSKRQIKKNKILVCDDEIDVRNVLKLILENSGFEVLLASNGIDGVQEFKENMEELNLVLLDLSMPEMNGDIAFQEMQEIKSDIPIILMSGYSEHEALNRIPGKKLAGFLNKPFNRITLLAKIQDILD